MFVALLVYSLDSAFWFIIISILWGINHFFNIVVYEKKGILVASWYRVGMYYFLALYFLILIFGLIPLQEPQHVLYDPKNCFIAGRKHAV